MHNQPDVTPRGRGVPALVLALTLTHEDRDDQIDGSLTSAAAAISAWIGYRRTNACRDDQGAAVTAGPAPAR